MRYDRKDKANESRRTEPQEQGSSSNSLFKPYTPEVFVAARPVEGKTARTKMAERLERVKSLTAGPVRKRIRVKQSGAAYPIRN